MSKKELNLSIRLFLIAVPKSVIACLGLSNIDVKNPVIVPMLLSKKLKQSLNAKERVSNTVLKASATFWFSLNTSDSFAKAATARPIPAAFIAVPILDIPPTDRDWETKSSRCF